MTNDLPRNRAETWLAAVWGLILRIVLLCLCLYVLYRLRVVIILVLVAVMMAFALAPLVDWVSRRRLLRRFHSDTRRALATTVVFALLAVVFVGMIFVIVLPLKTEVEMLASNWADHRQQINRWVQKSQEWFATLPPDIQDTIRKLQFADMVGVMGSQLQHFALRTLESSWFIVELILIPVLAFSFLTESRPLKLEFAMACPRRRLRDCLYILRQTGLILQSYAIGQLILALIAGIVVWVLMTVLGMKYALAMAVIAAITRVIPVVGPLMGGIPIVLVSALQGADKAVIILIAFTLMHLIETKVVMPRLIGYRIKLHPAVVIIVLLIGAEFFGMWGMFLAAPAAAVAKALFQYFVIRPRTERKLFPPASAPEKEPQVGRPTVAGIGDHSRAH